MARRASRTGPPAALTALAHEIEMRAAEAFRRDMRVQPGSPARGGYRAPTSGTDRAWRHSRGTCEVWCVLDAASQRSILESILDGPGAPTLTAVENAIVAESLARALGTAGQPQNLREELHVRPPADGMWRCDMELHGTINGSATIVMFAAAEEEPEPPRCAPADVGEVPFEARACLEPVRITLETVQSWRAGSIMQVAGSAAAARARFIASGRLLAVGELGESAGRRALRLASAP